nr:hypothetical protein CFP56_21666 [Quercus suber]
MWYCRRRVEFFRTRAEEKRRTEVEVEVLVNPECPTLSGMDLLIVWWHDDNAVEPRSLRRRWLRDGVSAYITSSFSWLCRSYQKPRRFWSHGNACEWKSCFIFPSYRCTCPEIQLALGTLDFTGGKRQATVRPRQQASKLARSSIWIWPLPTSPSTLRHSKASLLQSQPKSAQRKGDLLPCLVVQRSAPTRWAVPGYTTSPTKSLKPPAVDWTSNSSGRMSNILQKKSVAMSTHPVSPQLVT